MCLKDFTIEVLFQMFFFVTKKYKLKGMMLFIFSEASYDRAVLDLKNAIFIENAC